MFTSNSDLTRKAQRSFVGFAFTKMTGGQKVSQTAQRVEVVFLENEALLGEIDVERTQRLAVY